MEKHSTSSSHHTAVVRQEAERTSLVDSRRKDELDFRVSSKTLFFYMTIASLSDEDMPPKLLVLNRWH